MEISSSKMTKKDEEKVITEVVHSDRRLKNSRLGELSSLPVDRLVGGVLTCTAAVSV